MSAAVPGPGAAGWILAAGGALSLHLAALALLGLALAAPPEAPSEASGGIVIRNIPPVTATAPRTGRPRATPLGARRAALAPASDRLDPTAQVTAAAAPDAPRRAAPATRPGAADRREIPRAAATAQDMSPDRQAAPRRITATAEASRAGQSSPMRRVTATARDRPAPAPARAAQRVTALRQAPAAARTGSPRRIAPADPERGVPVAAAPRRVAPGGQRARAERQEVARRVASAPQDRSAALQPTVPRRATAADEARAMARPETPRRVVPEAGVSSSATQEPPPRRVTATGQATRPDRDDVRPRILSAARDSTASAPQVPDRVAAIGARTTARPAPATARAQPLSADRRRPDTPDRVPPTAPADSTPPRPAQEDAAQQASDRRAGQTPGRARAIAAPPRDPVPRRSRARRDGPDRRLSDRPAAPLRDPDAVALEQMRALLADLHGAPCHMVLPLPEGRPGFAAIGTDRARLIEAGPRLDTALGAGARPVLATHPVTADQCPAIDFVTGSRDDPRRGLALDLWRTVAKTGQPLTGTLLHEGAGALHLLLIDTAGRVHDLTGFLRPVPGGSHFSVPMSGGGLSGDARQLLLAVATPTPLRTLPPGGGSPADAGPLFAALEAELKRLGLVPDLALAAFVFD